MRYLVICSVLVAVLAGCAPVNVQTEYSDEANLKGLKTFDWLQTGAQPAENVRVNNPAVVGLVRDAVEKNLQVKGYGKDEAGKPDFLVTWFGAIEQKVKTKSIDHFYSTYGYGPVASQMPQSGKTGSVIMEYEEGTILVDVLNPNTHQQIWRGIGTDRLLKGMTENEASLYVNRVVAQIFKDFPRAEY